MSIYTTLMDIGIKRFDTGKYVDIRVQGVPPHIDDVGPGWEFLPLPVDPEGNIFRTVFFVEVGTPKGTPRSHQEYPNPLLKLTGQEYNDTRFVDLIARLEAALDARYGTAEWKLHGSR